MIYILKIQSQIVTKLYISIKSNQHHFFPVVHRKTGDLFWRTLQVTKMLLRTHDVGASISMSVTFELHRQNSRNWYRYFSVWPTSLRECVIKAWLKKMLPIRKKNEKSLKLAVNLLTFDNNEECRPFNAFLTIFINVRWNRRIKNVSSAFDA